MKKLFITMVFIIMLCTTTVCAEKSTATLPTFNVSFNGQLVESSYRQFPLIVHKDITYVPMTYFDCRYLGLTTNWDNDTKTLSIEKSNITCAYRDYNWEWENIKINESSVCDFNIVVNGKTIDNSKEEYPLLTFRDVTYFPLTWHFAVEEFGWEYSFDTENGLSIKSDGKHAQTINLPNIAGSVATDGNFYYYNGNDGNKHVVYRASVVDTNNPEIIFEFPESGLMRRVNFVESEGDIFFYYTVGGSAVMSSRYVKKINSDGTLSDEKPAYYSYSAHGYREVYARGDGIEVKAVNQHVQSSTEFSYTINGVTTEVEPYSEPIELGVSRNGKTSYSANTENYIRVYGDKIYFTAKSVVNSDDSNLYVIDTNVGKIEKLIEGVYGFHVYTGWDDKLKHDSTMIIYDNNGALMRYVESSNTSIKIEAEGEEELVLIAAAGKYNIATIQRTLDGTKTVVKIFDCYASGTGSIKGTIFETSTGTGYAVNGDTLCVYTMGESSDDDIRIVIPNSYFLSSDVPESIFVYGDTLIYKLDGENKVVKVDFKN